MIRICVERDATTVSEFPRSLNTLVWKSEHLTEIPCTLPASLERLYCRGSALHMLPDLPEGLRSIDCSWSSDLSVLPTLPQSLKYLRCDRTSVRVLPDLPEGLEVLDCSSTLIAKLPPLPNSLKALYCSFNPLLAELPNLPSNLRTLWIQEHSLRTLPVLPASVDQFVTGYSQAFTMDDL